MPHVRHLTCQLPMQRQEEGGAASVVVGAAVFNAVVFAFISASVCAAWRACIEEEDEGGRGQRRLPKDKREWAARMFREV